MTVGDTYLSHVQMGAAHRRYQAGPKDTPRSKNTCGRSVDVPAIAQTTSAYLMHCQEEPSLVLNEEFQTKENENSGVDDAWSTANQFRLHRHMRVMVPSRRKQG